MAKTNEDDDALFWLLVIITFGLVLLFCAAASDEEPQVYQARIREIDAEKQRRLQKEKQDRELARQTQIRDLEWEINIATKQRQLAALTVIASEDEQKLNHANERRQLDTRWQLQESLRALQSLIELQHWRRQQRDCILKDRALTSEEQGEDLEFVDDLFQQKRDQLKVDTRIFEEA